MPEAAGIGCMECDDCTVREVLTAAWPIIEAAIRSGDFDKPVVVPVPPTH